MFLYFFFFFFNDTATTEIYTLSLHDALPISCRRVNITALDPETGVWRALAVVGLTPEQERAWQADADRAGERDERADPAVLERLQAGEVVIIDMTQPPYSERLNAYGARTVLVA